MAHTTAAHVCNVIETQGVDTLCVEDLKTNEQTDFRHGGAKELCEHVEFLEANMGTPYRLRAWREDAIPKKGGRSKPGTAKPFVWTMLGRSGGNAGAAQVNGTNTIIREKGAAVDVDAVRRAAEAEAENAYLKRQVEELEDAQAALEKEADEIAAQPMQAAPAPVLKWWETIEGVEKAAGIAKGLGLDGLLRGLGAKLSLASGAPPQPMAQAAAPTNAPEGVTQEELELIHATRNWRKADPEQSEGLLLNLRQHYGPNAKPIEANGNA